MVPVARAVPKILWPVRPNYRDRSAAILSISLNVSHQLLEGQPGDRLALRRPAGAANGGSDPALADTALDDRFGFWPWWYEFGDNAAAIGNDHCLPRRRQANIFAEFIFKDFETDGTHDGEVASCGYFVNMTATVGDTATLGANSERTPSAYQF